MPRAEAKAIRAEEARKAKPFEAMSEEDRLSLSADELLAMAEEAGAEQREKAATTMKMEALPAPPTSKRFTETETDFFNEGMKIDRVNEAAPDAKPEEARVTPYAVGTRAQQVEDLNIEGFDNEAFATLSFRQNEIDKQIEDDALGIVKLGFFKKTKLKMQAWMLRNEIAGMLKQVHDAEDLEAMKGFLDGTRKTSGLRLGIEAGRAVRTKKDSTRIPPPGSMGGSR
jgi:uncharacterized protein YdcH (DUF465 family)